MEALERTLEFDDIKENIYGLTESEAAKTLRFTVKCFRAR